MAHFLTVGTYDGFILGYDLEENKHVIGYKSHQGCIKSIHASQNIACTTGTDESARVYDLEIRREIGELKAHEGYVTACAVQGRSYVITGGEDGKICIWRYSDLELTKTINTASPISCMALHKTGKILLTAHRRTETKKPFINVWDLTRATSAAAMPLELNVQQLEWCGSGKAFAILPEDGLNVQIVNADDFSCESYTRMQADKITAICYSDDTLLMGDAKGQLTAQRVGEDPIILRPPGEPGRIKSIAVTPTGIIAIAFPSGPIEVYRADSDEVQKFNPDIRITCIAMTSPKIAKKQKRGKRSKKNKDIDEKSTKAPAVTEGGRSVFEEFKAQKNKKVKKEGKIKKKKKSVVDEVAPTEGDGEKIKKKKKKSVVDEVTTTEAGAVPEKSITDDNTEKKKKKKKKNQATPVVEKENVTVLPVKKKKKNKVKN